MKNYVTCSPKQTQKLGEILARELSGGHIVCLKGELGSGKTTFAQGFLKGLNAKKPYTSPTFVVMKEYKINSAKVYHVDAYRVEAKDIFNLGWKEIIENKSNIVIIEWADRIRKIIPKNCLWVDFKWLDDKQRKITFGK